MTFRKREHPLPRLEGSDMRMLATRQCLSVMIDRDPTQVSRHCEPVACDVRTRLALYDADDVDDQLVTLPRRARARVA